MTSVLRSSVAMAIVLGLALMRPTFALPQEETNDEPAAIGYTISEYTTGIAYPVVSSSFDHQPQIEVLPDAPAQRIIPFYSVPWEGKDVEDDDKAPPPGNRIKKFGGFDGISQTPWAPPDPTLAVGTNHVLSTTNMQIAWWTKSGDLEFSQRLDSSGSPGFLEDVGAGDFTFDPKCIYDEFEDRFLVLALEKYSSTAYITIAISDDGDPNGTWYKYRTDAKTQVSGSQYWVDYPGLGYDDEAYYVVGNLFGFSGGFAGVKYRIFDKTPLLTGAPVVFSDLRDGNSASAQVAHMHDTHVAPLFASVKDSNEIRIQAIDNPLTAPVLMTTDVSVPSFNSPNSVPNLGGGTISAVDRRIMTVDFRDGSLYCGHNIDSSGRTMARWYEFLPNNWPNTGSVTLRQNGNMNLGSGIHTWFPAIAKNADGNTGIVMARSSTSEYASIWYSYRMPGDTLGTMRPAQEMKAGEGNYSGRWGDYFDIAVDPTNDTTLWGIGEYASSSGSWRTWIGILGINDGQITQIGVGSPGAGGNVPAIAANTPAIGETMSVDITNSVGGLNYWIAAGTSQTNVTAKGMTLYVNFPWTLLGAFSMGGAALPGLGNDTVDFDLPLDLSLLGFEFYLQALIQDPGAPFGFASTPAIKVEIGE